MTNERVNMPPKALSGVVVLVATNKTVADMIAQALRSQDAEVRNAEEPGEIRAILAKGGVDVVLVSWLRFGQEAGTQVRALGDDSPKLIIISGGVTEGDIRAAGVRYDAFRPTTTTHLTVTDIIKVVCDVLGRAVPEE